MSLQLLVLMVPVLFGLMGFALDLGRLYLIRGELNAAANAMALAGAAQLLGTDASLGNATTVAQLSLDNTNGTGNTYNFGALTIGQTNGNLTSTVNPPLFFAAVADATAPGALTSGNYADGTTARHILVSLSADAPLVFFGLLPGGQSLKTSVGVTAVAGISAPLCVACGIEPFAVAAIDSTDTANFGFGDPTAGTLYTLYASCTGTAPAALAAGSALLPYVIVNRYDVNNSAASEADQLYRDGAGGLVASATANPTGSPVPINCAGIGDASEAIWATAAPAACSSAVAPSISDALCGLQSRLDNTDPNGVCTTLVTDFTALSTAYPTDTDQAIQQTDLYTNYEGNGRRILTLPVVQGPLPTNTAGTMTVLGFRQFFLERNADGTPNNPADSNGRFVAMYIGSPAPVKAGYIDDHFQLGATLPTSGPGKVVLHQ